MEPADSARRSADLRLFLGCLVPPSAWFAAQQIDYLLKGWICATGNRWVVPLISAAALVLMGASAAGAGSVRRALPEGKPDSRRFLAIAALLLAGICALGVLSFSVPALVHHPCD